MTAFDRFDDRFGARLSDALDDLATPQYPDYFDDVLAEAMAHRQRPAWTFLERWIPMSTLARPVFVPGVPWRTLGVVLLLLALLVAGGIISAGLRDDDGPAPFGPAANGLIAYQANGDLYTLDLVTGDERLIVSGPELDVGPAFSRDGKWVAWLRFEGEESEGGRLMVAGADGSDVRPLTDAIELAWASWSPDSRSLAVIASPVGEEDTLQIISIDPNVEPTRVAVPVTPEGMVEWRPPAGDELIFMGFDGSFRAIYSVRPNGSGYRQISATGSQDDFWGPYEMTPDGSLMLYTDGSPVHVSILDLESGEVRPFGAALPDPEEYDGRPQYSGMPSILPDGETIVFGRYWNDDGTRINHQLWTASIAGDGTDAVPLGEVHRSQGGHNPFWQAVAPDGESILVVENDTFDAWLVDPDGEARETLDLRELNDPPSWQRVAP